ncbi:MAG: TetR/AcrR family transcriptional regulator [Anaerolineae bacterium]|nr:TetR/AcrR family transcriptional regulator [Anaerolineae bacterium]
MTPRIDPEERREEILDAVLRCFARTGYNGTSMDDVVEESGLSKGTLYWHFKNKRELFMAAFDRVMNQMVEPFMQMFEADVPVVERLRLFEQSSKILVSAEQELSTMPLNFLLEIWQDEEFSQHYLDVLGEFANSTREMIREGIENGELREVDVDGVTWGIMALYDGIFLYHLTGFPMKSANVFEVMTNVLIEGLVRRDDK